MQSTGCEASSVLTNRTASCPIHTFLYKFAIASLHCCTAKAYSTLLKGLQVINSVLS